MYSHHIFPVFTQGMTILVISFLVAARQSIGSIRLTSREIAKHSNRYNELFRQFSTSIRKKCERGIGYCEKIKVKMTGAKTNT